MKSIPSFGKILTLGSAYTENALNGEVIIQEKVDGSQFAFGFDEEGVLHFRSKSQPIQTDNPPKMFKEAVFHILKMAAAKKFDPYPNDSYFYGEMLEKPKHNVLKYDKIPKNHIVLFDAIVEGKFFNRTELSVAANHLEVDLIPELFKGAAGKDDILSLLATPSYLGGGIEGVVIKNYSQTIIINGTVCPLFTKYVKDSFKERHKVDWASAKGNLISFIQSFKNEARWLKAIQTLRDKELLDNQAKDIGPLIKHIQKDVLEEETENIKNELLKIYEDDILKSATRGFPEFYKKVLLDKVK